MAHMMLPSVRSKGFDEGTPGEWAERELMFLEKLTQSMDISGDNSQNGNVSSIPDVWAKPLTFKIYLLDDQKEKSDDEESTAFYKQLKNRVQGEWRCIMAMLALHKVKFLELSASLVELTDDGSMLNNILLSTVPYETIDSGTSWKKLYIINYKGKPFAMTSPTTLVSVAADYSRSLAGTLGEPWCRIENGYAVLKDPTEELDDKDRALLYGWLVNLVSNLRTVDGDCNALIKCVEKFASDVRGNRPENFGDIYGQGVESNLGLKEGFFRNLNVTAELENISVDESSVKIRPSIGKNPEKSLLLVDPKLFHDMAAEWRIDEKYLSVWGALSANNITDEMLVSKNRIGSADLEDAVWVRAKDFFTDQICVIESPDAFVNMWNPAARVRAFQENDMSVIPPLKPWLLEYLSIDEIKDKGNFEIDYKEDSGDIVVKLRLPFTYTDKGVFKERFYTIEKIYHDTDREQYISIEKWPLVEIWPNVKIEGWNKYYFCYVNHHAINKTDVAENSLLFTPWNQKTGFKALVGAGDEEKEEEIDCLVNKYTAKLKEFPEAMVASVYWKEGGYSPEKIDVGLLIIDQPRTQELNIVGGKRWRVGIDFGTSNTMLYYKDGNNSKPIVFEPELYQLMKPRREADRVTYMISNFIWPVNKIKNGSFLTIYNVLRATDSSKLEPLIDGNIFTLSSERFGDFAVSQVVPDLKWDAEKARKYQAQAYLEQICLQIAFKAACNSANSIEWKFSYPTAFSHDDLVQFRDMTEQAVKYAVMNTPFEGKNSVFKNLDTESVATAMYFNKLNGKGSNFSRGGICLDIGAGTTDLSIISSRPGPQRIVYHASIQYAGRVMFKPVFKWLERFLATEKNGIDLSSVEPDKRQMMLNAIMRDKSDEYMRKAADHRIGSAEEKILMEGVFQTTQLIMTGLFYYIGMILRFLKRAEIFGENEIPKIYIGGNGSRIIYWMCGATTQYKNNPHLGVLKRAIIASAKMDVVRDFDIILSEQPKVEVAAGMLSDGETDGWFNPEQIIEDLYGPEADEYTIASVIAGEKFMVGDEVVKPLSFMDARDVQAGIRLGDNMPRIEKVIKIFNEKRNERWGEDIDCDSVIYDVISGTEGEYIDMGRNKLQAIRVEPIFITAMKYLADIVMDNVFSKQGED